ncbi:MULTISPECIES: methionine synthase II (cobalamin-independent)-like protein [unclassified Streptomyces]|uniref:methionine synthase II (cobalamin-independent)-like protein n=1 Tax=unclassified Streptomyces TaxID=2593676 RepID=UPI0001C1A285|nr:MULTISPECIES: methionine synthase II (cobalamin-independent)-like protein [unclassified Streptomyces]AEN13843.1 Methionine synthase II (cobalamin-independent)-like protein [Streptomyces sp. SirexAA-E]MYR67925.1 methionine synthase II (cobalamin-independent)-like protein [Streptomyces sp. SID4939]MYS01606.1 methionine synthase II (cobalamin-independent)-like protein [Streptomyces sp. SID4940]MYT67732.1 methionine synthase II (cobalamin-independent)-like protein [Streptomyces sp. SID8357]MYT8
MADTFNYRIDHHGSLVRPAALTAARERAARDGDADPLRAAELASVKEAVAFQRRLRSTVVTDGDFPREDFRSAVLDNVSGFRRTGRETGGLAGWVAESLPKADGPLLADWATRLGELTQIAPKASLPSPAHLAATCFDPALTGSGGPASARELGEALAEIVRAEIELLISRGVRLVQLNNPLLLGHTAAEPGAVGALTFDDALAVEALALPQSERPEGVRIAVCPGWAAPTEVDRARAERLYAQIPADRWVLPYDQGTGAELDLLRAVPEDRDVCLGAVDATVPEIEEIDAVMVRIDAAAEAKDLEDMALAPSRGFEDVAGRPLLSAEDQHRKLIQVETLARYCWGNEF